MRPQYKIVSLHISAWLLYVLILFLGTDKPGFNFLANTISTIIPIIIIFYLSISFLFPTFLEKNRILLLVLSLIAINFLAIGLRLFLATILQQNGFNNFLTGFFSPVAFWNQFRVNLLFIGISFAYWYAIKNRRSEQQRQQLEKEILDARLSALKNQINPHFIHNTLSLIYTKSLPHSAELANAIAKLSEMMRYSSAGIGDNGEVSLEKEIMHISNFIDIQQMRFNNKLHVVFEKKGDLHKYKMMPLLLITFVENAFKHGDVNDDKYPLRIQALVSNDGLQFDIQNKKASWKKDQAHGIGLQNVRNRLNLAYPGKHELIVEDHDDDFSVNLKIALQP